MACPRGRCAGPGSTRRRSPASACTSRSRPPVCTNSPRLRTVVNPASSVLRTAGIARISFIVGSSCTTLMCVEPAPPIRKLSSMSMRPGSSVTSPSSITSASSGTRSGDTSTMRSPCDHHDAGLDDRPLVDVDHAVGLEHDRVVGRLRSGAGEHRERGRRPLLELSVRNMRRDGWRLTGIPEYNAIPVIGSRASLLVSRFTLALW